MLSTTAATAAEAITLVGQGIARGQAFDAIVIALEDVSGAGALLARTLGERTDGLSPHVILVAPPDQSPAISLQAPGWTTIPSPVGPAQLFDALAQLFRAGGQDGYSTAHSPVDIHATPPRSGERILVVEDVPLNQLVAQRALEYLGYRPVIADRGQVALRLLDESQFAIVLMDCRMPEMDGLEATRIIRQREAANGQRRIPIIGLTASAQDSDRKSCFDAGMDDYMSKPLDLVELARMLHRWTTGIELATTFEPAALPIQDFTGSTAVLDPTALAMIRTLQPPDDTDLLTEVIENFLDAAPTYLTQLTRAHQCGDYEEMTDAAHILKSAAAYVGARAVQELCRLVESCARSRVPDGVETLIDSLRTALREARVALAAELADQDVAA